IRAEELAASAYLDAPDELSTFQMQDVVTGTEIRTFLNIPLTVENRIIGMLSLFDERKGAFDAKSLKLTTMIADYAAVALENVRLRERETALWHQAELGRQRLELIIGSMADGLLISDEKGVITLLNSSAQRLLAHTKVDFAQNIPLRSIARSSNIGWLTKMSEIVDQALSGQIVMNQELIAGESSDTVPLTLSISAAPLHDASQATAPPVGMVAVLNDITSIKQIEKLKDEFVSVVSHELRTPLTAIKGYTQHLIRRVERRLRRTQQANQALNLSDTPEYYDVRNLHIVQSQTEHLERLVSDLLDLSRVQWGNLDLQYSGFFLADVLTESVNSIQASAEQHSIFLEIAIQDTGIVADRERIAQVIGNVLDNAVKYSPQGGQIAVRLGELDEDYLISVTDQGIGINPEYLDHVFERFYRVRNAASNQFSGIGLGLYVTRAIIEQHGGHIWVTNNQGIGSTFSFTLPRKPA
ncbi:MAG: ATP-binding protein, partial [Ktedonobacteraceae bacterium]